MIKTLDAVKLTQDLNQLLDPTTIKDFGPNGLMIMNEGAITRIATAFTPSLEIIEQAASLKAHALITHHGLLDVFPLSNSITYKKVKTLLSHNIALLRYHLPLDAHQELGNNWKAAKDLGWQNLMPFGMYEGSVIGVKGTFAPIQVTEFTNKLESYYGNKAHVAAGKKIISSAALISGGAHKYFPQAINENVDCFITGTYDDPAWDTAYENNITFCALGHAATEKIGPKALALHLATHYKIEAFFIDTPNPF